MDLGRAKHYTFCSFQKIKINRAISLQTDAKVHEYVRVCQCHRAYIIEQTFAVILHREAPAASCRLYSLQLIKEK
jgi:N-acyl-L-homoserine lactone synthetase